jgi:hypothetical protein
MPSSSTARCRREFSRFSRWFSSRRFLSLFSASFPAIALSPFVSYVNDLNDSIFYFQAAMLFLIETGQDGNNLGNALLPAFFAV